MSIVHWTVIPASIVDPGNAKNPVIDLSRRYSLRPTGNLKARYRREARLDRPADIC